MTPDDVLKALYEETMVGNAPAVLEHTNTGLEIGMTPGAAMAFVTAGAVSSIPAAIAVWALVKKPVFALYIAFALTGSLASGLLYQAWVA